MDRRSFLRTAVAGSITAGFSGTAMAMEHFFPTRVDQTLFAGINRVTNPAAKTPLEMTHAPVIVAPASVKAGEPFTVMVSVGETLHPMGTTHWIEYIELNIGNEPAGVAQLQSNGFLKPQVVFTVALTRAAAMTGKVTLMARERCNLHGLWEGSLDVLVT